MSKLYFITEGGQVYADGTEIKQALNNSGYLVASLGGSKQYTHRLVAQVFISKPDDKEHVNHKDSDRTNNHVDNLEWCSRSENMSHARAKGNWKIIPSQDNGNAKLTLDKAREIFRRLKSGESGVALAREFGVAHGRIYDIKHGRSWRAAGVDHE